MTIPDYQTLMLPLLRLCSDNQAHTNREAIEVLAKQFSLTKEEQNELLPSGRQCRFDNRVAWARAHLKMAGLIENVRRGIFKITDRGLNVLKQDPTEINIGFLKQYPEYSEKVHRKIPEDHPDKDIQKAEVNESRSPEEQLEDAYETIRDNLANEVLTQLKAGSPEFFEKVVVEVLVKMGYGGSRKDAGQAIGRSGDEGIDGIIKEDRLGLDIIYIQAKKWENTVSRPEIQKFAGALQGKRARKGVFITTSDYSKNAYAYADAIENKIILINGNKLAQFMIDFNVGVAAEATYELKRLDSDYFTEI